MKKIRKIARMELSNLFYSPIAWLLLCIFLVQCVVTFCGSAGFYLQMQEMAKLSGRLPGGASHFLLNNPVMGFFPAMIDKLYFYIPLITMGLISREVSSGSIRLLYSSPVTTTQIVLGKFLAMVYYSILLVAVMAIFGAIIWWNVPNVELGMLLTALFGAFLLLCCYSAIGLFMSCITSYQVVAALATLAIFAFLNYVGSMWQQFDFVRDLTYFLAMNSRVKMMFDGLLISRDVIYFVIITILFIWFSIMRLNDDQQPRKTWMKLGRYVAAFLIVLSIGYVTSRRPLTGYWDVTNDKLNTIAPMTQELLKETGNEPLELTLYVNLMDHLYRTHGGHRLRNKYLSWWEKYSRFKDIKFNYYYYYDTTAQNSGTLDMAYKGKSLKEVGEAFAETHEINLKYFHTPEESKKIPILQEEGRNMVMEFKYKGRTSALRMFQDEDNYPSEFNVYASIKKLMTPLQRVGVLAGQSQRRLSPGGRHYAFFSIHKAVRQTLINNGFEFLSIEEGQDIPTDLVALVVADPKSEFSEDRLNKLHKYIDGGGNLLITTDPGKGDIMKPLLDGLGLDIKTGKLVQSNEDESPLLIFGSVSANASEWSKGLAKTYLQNRFVIAMGSAALEIKKDSGNTFSVTPILSTKGGYAWLKQGQFETDSAQIVFDASAGDDNRPFPIAAALSRILNNKEQRILVSADADIFSNDVMQKSESNLDFSAGVFKWFSKGVFPPEISDKIRKDNILDLTKAGLNKIGIVLKFIIPGILAASAIVLLIRRKRK